MQVTKIPADIVRDEEMEYLKDANERQTRQFVAIIANRHGRHGVSLVCGILDIDRKTVPYSALTRRRRNCLAPSGVTTERPTRLNP